MARGDLVPPMANTLEVISELTPEELDSCWVWVATPRHIEKAAAAGARKFQYCLSASTSTIRPTSAATPKPASPPCLTRFASPTRSAEPSSCASPRPSPVRSTAITDPRRVLAIADDPRTDGADDIVLCDTIGQAIPTQVTRPVHRAPDGQPQQRMVFHGHDTWGLGVANTFAAIDAGATMVDGSLGGLGGCPFAPGASGNTSTEDLLVCHSSGLVHPENTRLAVVELTEKILAELDEPNRSKTAQGARSAAHGVPVGHR